MTGPYQRILDADLPAGVQRRIAKMVVDQYAGADALANELFEGPEAHDQRGNLRRGLIDQSLRGIFASLPGAVARSLPNAVGSCNHTEVRVGRVILT
jgi:hypothetical protein